MRADIQEGAALKLVAEVAAREAALAAIEKLRPQVAVLDIDMPKLDGLAGDSHS
jgi:CheY-like chemotaxis protein